MTERKETSVTRTLCYTAMATAMIVVCSWIAIPIGDIPVTLQTLGVCLVSALLGAKRAFFAVAAYLLLGLAGVPVFAGFTGGAAKLIGPTGGYLVGFLFSALLIGGLCKGKGFWLTALFMAPGLLVCYAFGTAWFVILMTQGGTPIGVWVALGKCVFPYLPFDALKILIAAYLTYRLKDKIS